MYSSGFIKQHPVLTFYVVTFAISWGGILLAVALGGMPRDPARLARMIPVMVAAMLAGPGVASISVTGIAGGREGYRDLLWRLIRSRVPIGSYATALLTAPLVLMTVPLALSLRFPNFVPRILTESNKFHSADGVRRWVGGWFLRGTGVDGFCHSQAQAEVRFVQDCCHCRCFLGSVALAR